jgi:hypothetical protein
MIDNDNSIIESLNSVNFNEPHPVKLPSAIEVKISYVIAHLN